MAFFSNRDINRLVAHTTLHQLAWGTSGAFMVVFLLKMGLSPAAIFLSIGAILGLRLVFRPLVPRLVTTIGSRRALVLGTVLVSAHFPILAFVEGPDLALASFCLT